MTRHIGIVAVSPEGAALCYRQIYRQAGPFLTPDRQLRVSLHSEPLAHYVSAVRGQDWHAVGDLLRRSADLLAQCGAQFCLSPDNAVQYGVQLAESGSPIPWLTMPDLVAKAVDQDNRKVVGLIGTKMVTTASTYQTHLGMKGVQVLAPGAEEVDELDRIIFSELLYGEIKAKSQQTVLTIVRNLADRGCEAIILASSEAPLVITQAVSPLPLYDAAEILARGAVRRALSP